MAVEYLKEEADQYDQINSEVKARGVAFKNLCSSIAMLKDQLEKAESDLQEAQFDADTYLGRSYNFPECYRS